MNENFLTNRFFKNRPKSYGNFLALIGVLILTPDTMVMRLSNLDRWPLMGWRGVLMGITLLILWSLFQSSNKGKKISSIYNWQGVVVILAFGINSVTFTLGIQETSVMVVLTAVATMPVFAAFFSVFFMKESQGLAGWATIIFAMVGVVIVVSDGNNAIGHPEGSSLLGAIYGCITASGLALAFTMARKYRELEIIPAAAIGSLLSGIFGFILSAENSIFTAPIWTIVSMGILILPVSFGLISIAPRYTTSAIVSLIMLLEMVIGPFWVWIAIGEKPSITMILGAFLVITVIFFHITRTQFYLKE